MPVFEATDLDGDPEGQAILAAILHPTRAARSRALRQGRRRVARTAALHDPTAVGPRSPSAGSAFCPASLPSD